MCSIGLVLFLKPLTRGLFLFDRLAFHGSISDIRSGGYAWIDMLCMLMFLVDPYVGWGVTVRACLWNPILGFRFS